MGVDYHLAFICNRVARRDFFACEISEGAAFVLASAIGLAFLGGICGIGMAPFVTCGRGFFTCTGEALIEERFPETFARRQPYGCDQVVSQ